MLTLAVIPGYSLFSSLGAAIITLYVTTLLVTVGLRRSCCTVPVNWSSGKASTVKVTLCPSFTCPMSASSMLASTCISVRLLAMVKRVGVLNDAATVCPSSTSLFSITPSMGE